MPVSEADNKYCNTWLYAHPQGNGGSVTRKVLNQTQSNMRAAISARDRQAHSGRGWLHVFILTVLAVTAATVACTSARSQGEDAAGAATTSSPAASDASAALRIVAYQGKDELGGSEVSVPDLFKQGKPVVINFWAGLCPPCRQEMPGFQRVYEEFKGRFLLVGIDVGPFVRLGSHDDARQLLDALDITYPTAYAVSADILKEYKVLGMPTTIFFTPDGKVFRQGAGFIPEDTLRKELEDLLDVSAGNSR